MDGAVSNQERFAVHALAWLLLQGSQVLRLPPLPVPHRMDTLAAASPLTSPTSSRPSSRKHLLPTAPSSPRPGPDALSPLPRMRSITSSSASFSRPPSMAMEPSLEPGLPVGTGLLGSMRLNSVSMLPMLPDTGADRVELADRGAGADADANVVLMPGRRAPGSAVRVHADGPAAFSTEQADGAGHQGPNSEWYTRLRVAIPTTPTTTTCSEGGASQAASPRTPMSPSGVMAMPSSGLGPTDLEVQLGADSDLDPEPLWAVATRGRGTQSAGGWLASKWLAARAALRERMARLSFMDELLGLPQQCLFTVVVAMFIL